MSGPISRPQYRADYVAADYGRVAICAGGMSAERTVSLASGAAVLAALQQAAVAAELVDLDQQFFSRALAGDFDRVFIAIHGRGGEDGALQGWLDMLQLPYTGSGAAASMLAMDKQLTKLLWQVAGLPTPAWMMVSSLAELRRAANHLGIPLMLKPVSEGSSIGMSLVETADQLDGAWQLASAQNQPVMAESYITGNEYTAGLVLDEQLPLIRITTPRKFYDYEAKYNSDQTGYHYPAGLDDSQHVALTELATRAFDAIGGSGWGRVDLIVDERDQPWLIEANTVPGLTDHSLVPMAAKARGWQLKELMLAILQSSFYCTFSGAARELAHA